MCADSQELEFECADVRKMSNGCIELFFSDLGCAGARAMW